MRYTLRQLQIFSEIARHQNVSRAAQQLHVSQSAASEALQNFEKVFDMALFDRVGNRLVLNAHGERVLREADAILAQAQGFENRLLGINPIPDISVGASFTIGNHLATKIMANYLEHQPKAHVSLSIASTPSVIDSLVEGDIDIGMVEWPLAHPDVQLIPWREDELVIFSAADHPLAARAELSEEDILDARWIVREENAGLRRGFDMAMARFARSLNIFLELRHNEAIKTAVLSGLGLGCLSRMVVAREFEYGDLVPLVIPGADMRRQFYFAIRKTSARSAALELWMKLSEAVEI
jgi:DNA-binding transcriptional LysR family regulator